MATESIDLKPFAEWVPGCLEAHREGTKPGGPYTRMVEPGAIVYGTSDAVCILYTVGKLPPAGPEHDDLVRVLEGFQDVQDGLFYDPERTHHVYHTTAFVVAALELLDARPVQPLRRMHQYLKQEALERFLDGLDWTHPWGESHKGAGVASALAVTDAAPPEWYDWYFDWLNSAVDPATGYWRRGVEAEGGRLHQLGGAFHFYFVYEHFGRPLPYPERVIDATLELQQPNGLFGAVENPGYIDLDGAYALERASRQTGHHQGELREGLATMARTLGRLLTDPVFLTSRTDLHNVCALVSLVAELQIAVPGILRTPEPWSLVLDRRPFI